MMSIYKCLGGTIDSCPFAPRGKMIDPVVGAALISGGVDLLGNVLGFGSSQSANRTNIEIAKMNNEAQMNIMRSQQAYNEQMWNKQNEYNLPSNQVQRLLAAGINPAAVFGNGSVSEAGSLTAPQMPSLQQARVNPFTPDMTGINQAVNAYFQNQLISKDIESKGLDNNAKQIELQFKVSRILLDMKEQVSRINKQLADTSVSKQQKENLVSQRRDLENHIKLFEENYEFYSEREKLQNDVMRSQQENLVADSTLKRVQASFQSMMLSYYPQLTQAQLGVMSAQFYDLCQSAQLKAKQGELTSAQSIHQYIENGIKAMDFEHLGLKHKIKFGSGKAAQSFWYSLDMISDAIFGNLKLFGK